MTVRSVRVSPLLLGVLLVSAAAAYGCGGNDDAHVADAVSDSDPSAGDGGTTTSSPPGKAGAADAAEDGPTDDAAIADAGEDAAGDDDAGDAGAGDAGPAGPLSPGYADFSINHVLVTGQSNSVANGARPALSTTQPYTNLMFSSGVMPMTACEGDGCRTYQTPTALSPLVEGDRFFNYPVETPSAGLANEIARVAAARFEFGVRPGYPSSHDVLVSVHGRSGNTYWCLRKGSCAWMDGRGYVKPFDQALLDVTNAKALAAAAGRSYVVRAVATIHGESDHYYNQFPLPGTDGTPNKIKSYADALIEWQADLEASIKAITGQTQPIPLLVSGLSGWNNVPYSVIPGHQLDAHVRAPGKVVLMGPTYMLPVANDCLHFTSHGSRRLGEYLAKVYAKVVFAGETWEPVRPKQITRAGNVVTVTYHVPVPPLALDTTRVTNPGDYGFELLDDSGSTPTITSVAVTAPDAVTITLSAAPTGANKRLRYALRQTPSTCIGPGGARGNLRDSDQTPSENGYELHNWGVAFDAPLP